MTHTHHHTTTSALYAIGTGVQVLQIPTGILHSKRDRQNRTFPEMWNRGQLSMPKHPEKQPVKELCKWVYRHTHSHTLHTRSVTSRWDRWTDSLVQYFQKYIFIHLQAKALRHQWESFIHPSKMKVILLSVFSDDVWVSLLPSCTTTSYLQEVHFHCAYMHCHISFETGRQK